jgi:hypothetical protein
MDKNQTLRQRSGQAGFSVVEGLLILVIVGVLGGVGWYVYDSNQKANDNLNNADSSSSVNTQEATQKEEPKVDAYKGWQVSKNVQYSFEYKYPSERGWRLAEAKPTPGTYGADNGHLYTSAVAFDDDPALKGEINVFELYIAKAGSEQDFDKDKIKNNMKDNSIYKLTGEKNVKKGNLTGEFLVYTPSENNTGKIFYYFFKKDNLAYNVTINYGGVTSEKADVEKLGEQIYNSLVLK